MRSVVHNVCSNIARLNNVGKLSHSAISLMLKKSLLGTRMIKQVSFFKRRKDLSTEDFREHWRSKHADVVRRLNGLVRYVQNHALEASSGFDGIAEVWFEDMESMRANVDTPELKAIRSDEENFIDSSSMGTILTNEYVIKETESVVADQKLMALVNRLEHNDATTFHSIYRDQLGPLVAAVPNINRYVQAHTGSGIYKTNRQPLYDAVASLWFTEIDVLVSSPEMRTVREVEHTILDLERTQISLVEEFVITL